MGQRRCDTSPLSCASTRLDLNDRDASILGAEVFGHDQKYATTPPKRWRLRSLRSGWTLASFCKIETSRLSLRFNHAGR
jgi:hypothetical protein